MKRRCVILIFFGMISLITTVYLWAQEADQSRYQTLGYINDKAQGNEQAVDISLAFMNFVRDRFTGDLDGMIERRLIRVLVTFNKTHFFIDRGAPKGIIHDLFSVFEDELNSKLDKRYIRVNIVFIPVFRDELEIALIEGRGDIAAANLTITSGRSKKVDFTEPLFRNVSEIVVTGPVAASLNRVEDLSGKEVYIRKSSSFYDSLLKLNKELKKVGKKPVMVRPAPEVLETEDILEMVNAGLVGMTIADSHIAEFWEQVFDNITLHPEAAVKTGRDIGMMIRKNSPKIKKELNEFFASYAQGSRERNILLQKYLKNTRYAEKMTSAQEIARCRSMENIFKKYGDKYNLDHLLMLAQGYQESRLDQSARSLSGAVGVMQLLPSTGDKMNVGDITELEPNIHAGVKYVRFIIDHYYANESMDKLNKGLFAMASYNAGPTRISRLRSKAVERGLDPNKWFNNVEVVVAEEIGLETVQYVSNIYKYYLAYKMITEKIQIRSEVMDAELR